MTKLTAKHIENSIVSNFVGWQDSDEEDGKETPLYMSYVMLKEALGLPQIPVNKFENQDKIVWLVALNNYTMLRNVGYEHFDAIKKIAEVHTRNNL
jgi:hypothetical protein